MRYCEDCCNCGHSMVTDYDELWCSIKRRNRAG